MFNQPYIQKMISGRGLSRFEPVPQIGIAGILKSLYEKP
jgi:hypothetical protein